jgi:ribosomal protein RSM22 (predicted rRNA methylase)
MYLKDYTMAKPYYFSQNTPRYTSAISSFADPNFSPSSWADKLVSDIVSPSSMLSTNTITPPLRPESTQVSDEMFANAELLDDYTKSAAGVTGLPVKETKTETPWFKDSDLLSSYAGLGTALVGLYDSTIGPKAKYAKEQTNTLKQNRQIAADRYADLKRQKEGFRNFKVDGPSTTSAFTG